MRKITAALIAITGLGLGLGSVALAADLPPRQPEYKAPAVVVAPATPWTGCYIGGNGGAVWGNAKLQSNTAVSVQGTSDAQFAVGGQFGCDYQAGAWVFGGRNLTDWADTSRTATLVNGTTVTVKNNWFDLLTGRIGYTLQPAWLFYFQGGVAWRSTNVQQFNAAGAQIGSSDSSRVGWTAGLGSEYKFTPNWSVFAEWNYVDFGSNAVAFAVPLGFNGSVTNKSNQVLLGVNYRF